MKKLLSLWLLLTTLVMGADPESKPHHNALGKSTEASYQDKVVVIQVGEKDLINQQAFKFFRRTLERVEEEKARAVIFELDTPGGIAFATTDLMMKNISQLSVPTYAFVNIEATSAGAFVAVATDTIYMAPLSTIGSAAVINGTGQKMEETMRAKAEGHLTSVVRNIMDDKGHNYEVMEAMMILSKEIEFGDIISVGESELLNLTAVEATTEFEGRPLLAKGIASSIEELLEKEGIEAEVVVAKMTGFEKFAYWIGAAGGLLILIGLGAGYLEMKTPGFGLGALVAIIAFSLFFFGNYVAGNLAGYETAAIFLVGVVFILLDIFLFPGTFVMGIVGIFMILGSLLFSMVDRFAWDDWQADAFGVGLWNIFAGPATALSLGLIGSIALFAIAMRYLPRLPFFDRYFLPTLADGDTTALEEEANPSSRVGWTGEAKTDLRPAGKALFQGQEIDVTCESSFVPVGTALQIVSEEGMKVVVKVVN